MVGLSGLRRGLAPASPPTRVRGLRRKEVDGRRDVGLHVDAEHAAPAHAQHEVRPVEPDRAHVQRRRIQRTAAAPAPAARRRHLAEVKRRGQLHAALRTGRDHRGRVQVPEHRGSVGAHADNLARGGVAVAEAAHAAAVHGLPREQRAVGVEAPHAAVRVADLQLVQEQRG